MKCIKIILSVLIIGFAFTGYCNDSAKSSINIVKNGKICAVIVIPDNAIPCEKLAADELQYHIKKASGVKIPIHTESSKAQNSENSIYIGNCVSTSKAGINTASLAPSGYIIRTIGNNLFIAGKDRTAGEVGSAWFASWQGTLFGVYDLLEKELGVRWLWPGKLGELIPQKREISFNKIARSGKPRFVYARLLNSPRKKYDLEGWNSLKNKEKFFKDQYRFLLRHRFASTENMNYCHNFANYWKRFKKSHPDYFSLLPNGKRQPLAGNPSGNFISLCISQPALWKQIVKDWKGRSRKAKELRPYVNACLNDTPGMCTCTKCRSWDAYDPAFKTSAYWGKRVTPDNAHKWSIAQAAWGEDDNATEPQPYLSDRYAKFYLNVLNEAKKIDTAAKLVGYAYANYAAPPKETKLNEDIIIMNVFPLWFPYTPKMSKAFRSNWKGWRNTGVSLYFRPNLLHAGANLPIFYARQFAKDFSFAARNGMIASMMDSLLGAWSTQGPTLYTVTRIHEHPEWSADKILEEYYTGFGKAKNAVKNYFSYWENHSKSLKGDEVAKYRNEERDWRGRPGGGFQNYVLIAHRLFKSKNFTEAKKLLAIAAKAARGDKLAEKRVAFLGKGLKDAELTVAVRKAQVLMRKSPSPENKKNFANAFKKLIRYRASIEADKVCDFGIIAFREKTGACWPWQAKNKFSK
jgi:hypothetical protein